MQILFIVLNDLSYLDKILDTFLEHKVRGGTIIDSQGMAAAIMQKEGGFGALLRGPFARSLENDQKMSKTIFTVIPESEKVEAVVSAIQGVVANSKKQVIGFMFTMPVSGIYPMKPRIQ